MSASHLFASPHASASPTVWPASSVCKRSEHLTRRSLLKFGAAGLALSWTHVAKALARAEGSGRGEPPRSVIILWLQGGPSQLETFDPHPGAPISDGVRAIPTRAKDVEIGEWFPRLAEHMHHVALVRSVVSKEGDHERATYNAKTGYRPDPTLVHPSLGAIICHQTSDSVEIPRHISILPGAWPARGGYLGDALDAFKVGDPLHPIADVEPRVSPARLEQRIVDLKRLDEHFARGRLQNLETTRTLHRTTTQAALQMMSSEQLKAFAVRDEPLAVQRAYGESPFGRACLAARRLVEVGVRCIEVTLDGWDSHINNRELQQRQCEILDPAIAALLQDLEERDLLSRTLVICGGEFGRTPWINKLSGRDHWPHGFTVALAGAGIRGGQVVGATSPTPRADLENPVQDVEDPRPIADIHATALAALGIDIHRELMTPVGRPMKLCEGQPIDQILTNARIG